MKLAFVLVALVVLGTRLGAYVPGPQGVAVRTTVTFFESENFADVGENMSRTPRDAERTLAALKDYFVQQASRFIPANFKLLITIMDVDQAGDFEPWHGPSYDHIRIVKDVYPPRIALVFRVLDPEGNVVREGKRELRDPGFMSRLVLDRNDPLRYEKELIDAWLRQEFGR